MLFLLSALLVIIPTATSRNVPTYAEGILTRSTAAKGILRCGKEPAVGVHVRIYRNVSEVKEDLLAATTTDNDGSFTLEGTTAGRPVETSGIEPTLRFYHKCDVEAKKKDEYRKYAMHYGHSFVTLGRIPRKPYNVGILNLQLVMPNEKIDKKFEVQTPELFTRKTK